jgi:hypothetical protein
MRLGAHCRPVVLQTATPPTFFWRSDGFWRSDASAATGRVGSRVVGRREPGKRASVRVPPRRFVTFEVPTRTPRSCRTASQPAHEARGYLDAVATGERGPRRIRSRLGTQFRVGGPFQPINHRQDADATEYVSSGDPLSVPPIPTQDGNRTVEETEPGRKKSAGRLACPEIERILWLNRSAEKHETNNLLIILLPSFQGGRQTKRMLGGSLSPSIFAPAPRDPDRSFFRFCL